MSTNIKSILSIRNMHILSSLFFLIFFLLSAESFSLGVITPFASSCGCALDYNKRTWPHSSLFLLPSPFPLLPSPLYSFLAYYIRFQMISVKRHTLPQIYGPLGICIPKHGYDGTFLLFPFPSLISPLSSRSHFVNPSFVTRYPVVWKQKLWSLTILLKMVVIMINFKILTSPLPSSLPSRPPLLLCFFM